MIESSIDSMNHLNPLILPDPSLFQWNQTTHSLDFEEFVHKHQPMLCGACINLATVFSDPSLTRRGLLKASVFNIDHHHNLVSLFESSRTFPLCSLIVVAVPGLTEWLWRDVLRDILRVELVQRSQSIGWGGLNLLLDEWIEHLDNTEGRLNASQFSGWEDKYAAQVLRLGACGMAPALGEVIRTFYGDLMDEWLDFRSLEIRERYAIKAQISEVTISLGSTGGILGPKDLPTGNLRVSSHSSMQPSSHPQ
jgi:hypothetical protein